MEYKLNKTKAQGLPFTNNDGVYVIPTIIYSGIVGQTYAGFENVELDNCPISTSDNTDQIQAKMDAFGMAYVAAKYPNT